MPQPEITTSPLEPNIRSVDSMPQHAGVEFHLVSGDGALPPAGQRPRIMRPLPRTIRAPILLRLLAKHEHYDRMAVSLESGARGLLHGSCRKAPSCGRRRSDPRISSLGSPPDLFVAVLAPSQLILGFLTSRHSAAPPARFQAQRTHCFFGVSSNGLLDGPATRGAKPQSASVSPEHAIKLISGQAIAVTSGR